MMASMLKLAGVELVNFDFCVLGMKTTDAQGQPAVARKRTKILTNSRHVANALRACECQGVHVHEVLEGGGAKACEQYPEAFSILIVKALQREMGDAEWLDNVNRCITGGTKDTTVAMERLVAAMEQAEGDDPSSSEMRSALGWLPGADEAAVPKPRAAVSAVESQAPQP